MFDGRWREAVDAKTGPVGQSLHRHGVTADVLTATGLVSATATAVAVATGHLHLAIVFLILTGAHDLFDGPVAKAAGTASVRGAFFDSVTDRVADAVLMVGVAWYLVSVHEGHLAVLPLAVLGMTSLISYERAKAEALGLDSARGGLMERAERMILLGVGFLASWLLVPVLWALLALTAVTAVGRFVRVWRSAGAPAAPPSRRARPVGTGVAGTGAADVVGAGSVAGSRTVRSHRRQARVESRWRAWREGATPRTRVGRAGEPLGRWRARRQEALASRSGRAMRARRRSQTRTTSGGRPGTPRGASGRRRP